MSEYGEPPVFYLVDIKDIESDVTRSTFDEQELEELADLILVTGCLLQPLILTQIGPMAYKVLEKHFEYHAAIRANEKDTKRYLAGMVSAFVIKQEIEATVIEQARILNKVVSTSIAEPNSTSDHKLDRRINNLENRLDNGLQEVKITHRQDTQRLEEQIKQLQSQMPKQLEPLEVLNTLDVNKLRMGLMGLKVRGMTEKKIQETVKKIDKERKKSTFTDLQDVINRKVGITANTMIKIIDTWSRVGFFF
ncbi:conserved hypothetical protein [Beggiatoa sp. PS]|nr:conserved hypothetical protein [Beggiatoa sp. PS]